MRGDGGGRFAIQFLKFNAVGLINTGIDFLLFTLLLLFGMGSLGAQVISYAAGTVNSYILNKKITFSGQEGGRGGRSMFVIGQFARFAALNAAVLALSLLMLFVFTSLAGLHPLTSKVLVTAVTVGLNFLGSRKWVFTKQTYGNDRMEG
ncbi:GtrA family protein [Paenibacillus woosongensis]|uniref:GtrA family protein n=1 Tax=Paenibacillus woosongensis TaxID=307580 RepID=A0A7X3CP76_9BACL|nr:GtrA family protein [Paenibacillus woosongensis]MUG46574.1 GtrA family protein [Paenibacillus woosongensis]